MGENILNSGSSYDAIPGVHAPPFNKLDEIFDIFVDQRQDDDSLSFLIFYGLVGAILSNFSFLTFQQINDIFSDYRELHFDVLEQNHVHSFYKILDSHAIGKIFVLLMFLEKLYFLLLLLFYGNIGFCWTKENTDMSKRELITQYTVVFENIYCGVNQIDLSEHSNGSHSFFIDFSCQFQRL